MTKPRLATFPFSTRTASDPRWIHMPLSFAPARQAARTASSSSPRRFLRARAVSRSSRPDISGVNRISAPPSAASPIASTSARALPCGSMPVRDWKSAILVIRSSGDQRVELASALQCDEIVAAADMALSNENLGYGHSSVGALDHHLFFRTCEIDHDLLVHDTLGVEQVLGPPAIGTSRLGVDFHSRHMRSFRRSTYAWISTHQLRRAHHPGPADQLDPRRAGAFQGAGAGFGGTAGRQHVVDEDHGLAGYRRFTDDPNRASDRP